MRTSRSLVVPVLAAALLGSVATAPSAFSAAPAVRSIAPACAASPDAGFADTLALSPELRDAIGCLGTHAVAMGNADGTYRPGSSITRGQMALFLARELAWISSTNENVMPPFASGVRAPFSDLDAVSDEMYDAIVGLKEAGVIKGTASRTFKPSAPVTRQDMAAFIVRMQSYIVSEGLDGSAGYVGATTGTFSDVPASLPRAGDIEALATTGIALGGKDGLFRPYANVTRGQMALFMARHLSENVEGGRAMPAEPGVDVIRNISTVTRYTDLSEAVDAAGVNDTLTLQGEFTETAPVLLDAPIWVSAHGDDMAVLHGSVRVTGAGVAVQGLVIDSFVAHETALAGVYLDGATEAFLLGNDIVGTAAGTGVRTTGTVTGFLAENSISDAGTGIVVSAGSELDVLGNTISGASVGLDLAAPGSAVTVNTFEGNAVHVRDSATPPYDLAAMLAANEFPASAAVVDRTIADSAP